MNNRPKTIPEMRGHSPIPRDRVKLYSPESYAAQYGITVDDAEEFVERSSSHREVERKIFALFREQPDVRQKALMLDEAADLTEEEEELVHRILTGKQQVNNREL